MSRKFWIAWVFCLIALLALFAIASTRIPNRPDATAGLVPGRIGLIAGPTVILMVYAAYRVARLDDPDGPAGYLIPVGLAVAVGAVGLFAGFVPDTVGCFGFNIERFGPLPPECMTADETRVAASIETAVMWVAFGLIAVAVNAWVSRRHARATSEGGSARD